MSRRLHLPLLSSLAVVVLTAGLVFAHDKSARTEAARAAAEARLLEDIKYLAGPECEGRGTRTEGINKAADHIAQQLQKAGLKPGGVDGTYFQPFQLTSGARIEAGNALSFTGPKQKLEMTLGQQFSTLPIGSAGEVSAPLVFVGYGLTQTEPAYDDYAGVDVKGKVVILLRRVPRDNNREVLPRFNRPDALSALTAKVANAEIHGAAGVLVVTDAASAEKNDDALITFASQARVNEWGRVPVLHVKRALVNQILAGQGTDLAAIERQIDRDFKPQSFEIPHWTVQISAKLVREGTPVKNIIGVVEGAGPLADETVVIGAHYDHLGYGGMGSLAPGSKDIHFGADDNASGSTTILELARRAAALKDRQGRRLVFIWFSAEELGLLGAYHYTRNPMFPLEKTVAMLNLDMVGRLRDGKLRVYGTPTAKEFADIVEEANKDIGLKLNPLRPDKPDPDNVYFSASDHYAFYQKNIPVLFFFTGNHPQYHRPTDTWNLINVEGMRQIAELGEGVIERLATMPRPEFIKLPAATSSSPGRIAGPRLGVMPAYDDDKEGMLLEGVSPGGAAEKAGLKGGDRIIELAGKPVKNVTGYMTIMGTLKRGEKVDVVIVRNGEKVKLTLEPQ